jgi:3-mercaptopyruvate sulfurtransferase SseA
LLFLASCASTPALSPVADNPPKPASAVRRGEVSEISLEEFFARQQAGKVLIFDARPAIFHSMGHIPGAISLPKHNCDETIAAREAGIKSALAGGKTIVVYCNGPTCQDARTVAKHIAGFGHPASIFSGGWDAWKQAGMPVE